MYERPGRGFYPTAATKQTNHLDPCIENGIPGAAIKQKARPWSAGYDPTVNTLIVVGEPFQIRTKGIHEFDTSAGKKANPIAAATLGAGIYIRPSDNTLHILGSTATGDIAFGRVVEVVGGNRGVPANKIRIDLDQRGSIEPISAA